MLLGAHPDVSPKCQKDVFGVQTRGGGAACFFVLFPIPFCVLLLSERVCFFALCVTAIQLPLLFWLAGTTPSRFAWSEVARMATDPTQTSIWSAGTSVLKLVSLFAQKFTWVKPPKDDLVKSMCEVPDHFPFDRENDIVRALTADMVKNPSYQAPPIPPPEIANAGFSELWTTQRSTDIPLLTRRMGLLQDSPHPIRAGFVKVPAFWSAGQR